MKMVALRIAALAWLVLVSLLAWAPAQAVVVDFETAQSGEVVTDQFAGVTFNAARVRDFSPSPGFAHSGTKAVELCFAQEFCSTPLVVDFSAAQSRVKVWVGNSGQVGPGQRVILRTFDQGGAVIAEISVALGPSNGPLPVQTPLEIVRPSPQIRRALVTFAPSGGSAFNNGLVIDDIEFDVAGSLPPCGTDERPVISLVQPQQGLVVNVNHFRLEGSVATTAPLVEATLTVAGPGGTTTSNLLGSLLPQGGGSINTNFGDALRPGSNLVTLRARNCRGPASVSRTVVFAPVAEGTRLKLLGLEVVQATQDTSNSVPLVAAKPTIVRTYLGLTGPTTTIFNVSATITARGPGGMLVPSLPSENEITLGGPNSPGQRGSLAASLYFKLPAAWTAAGYVHFEVEKLLIRKLESHLPCDGCTNFAAPLQPRWVQFRPTRQLNLVLVPYEYLHSPATKTPDSLSSWGALQWLNSVYPLRGTFPGSPSGIRLLRLLPLRSTSRDLSFASDEGSGLLSELTWMRFLLKSQNPGWPADFRLLAVTPCGCGGRARGSVAYVDSWNRESGPVPVANFPGYGATWSHEVGHTFGREHAGNAHGESGGGDVDSSFPFLHGAISQPGIALTSGQPVLITPVVTGLDHAHDFMSYGRSREWVSPYTYRALFARFATSAAAAPAPGPVEEKLIVIGHIRPDESVDLSPFRRVSTSMSSGAGIAGEFRIDLLDATGTVLGSHHFDAVPTGDSNTRGFEEYVPWREGTRRIVLSGRNGIIATRQVSSHAPWVRVTAPYARDSKGGRMRIGWQAGDRDGDRLTFTILYSSGPDQPWIPVVGETTGNSAVLDTRLLPGSDRARLRILATDGVNVAGAETARVFAVPDKPPLVDIVAPAAGAHPAGAPLVGIAYDPEEGLLDERSLTWTSDRDGALGYGTRIEARALSAGAHRITLTGRDRGGRRGMAQLAITIGADPYRRAD